MSYRWTVYGLVSLMMASFVMVRFIGVNAHKALHVMKAMRRPHVKLES